MGVARGEPGGGETATPAGHGAGSMARIGHDEGGAAVVPPVR
jgi:hypothetical protein